MATMQTFSMNELAGLLGVTRQTVDRWLKQGCPYVEKADRDRGREWQLSLPGVVEWRERRAVEQAVGDTSKLDIDEARRRKTAAEAALAELELSKLRSEVVSLSVVSEVIGDQLSACRARLLSLPTKIAPLVAPLTNIIECRDAIDAAVREALDEISGYDGVGGDRPADIPHGRDDETDNFGADEIAAEVDSQPVGRPISKAKRGGQRGTRPVGNGS